MIQQAIGDCSQCCSSIDPTINDKAKDVGWGERSEPQPPPPFFSGGVYHPPVPSALFPHFGTAQAVWAESLSNLTEARNTPQAVFCTPFPAQHLTKQVKEN